jgi:hypothetical protein
MPADLDSTAKKKWNELAELVDENVDGELLGHYCRQWSSLLSLRREKSKQVKDGSFKTMVRGRDSSEQLNPMLREENRLVSALARMLRSLGLTPTRDEQEYRKKKAPNSGPPPPGFSGPEPKYGWVLEAALCKGRLEQTPEEIEQERLRDAWVAARREKS